ncbi:MAG: hypothetical protein IJS10_02730 [Alphaproteobacteria bacterium]|nr:hypothetical protein [Alphaproteobacteria bacterium]
MKISQTAAAKIKATLQNNPEKLPRIVLKKGGCAGNTLVLLLATPEKNDTFLEIDCIRFAIAEDAMQFIDDIFIDLKTGLTEEITVQRTNAHTCRCGKSFRL